MTATLYSDNALRVLLTRKTTQLVSAIAEVEEARNSLVYPNEPAWATACIESQERLERSIDAVDIIGRTIRGIVREMQFRAKDPEHHALLLKEATR